MPQLADVTEVNDAAYGIAYARTTPEGFTGVGYRAVSISSTQRIPVLEISTQQMVPGERMTLLCHMGTEKATGTAYFYFDLFSDQSSSSSAGIYNFWKRQSEYSEADNTFISVSRDHADVVGGSSLYTLDHGDYFQITLEWIDNSTIAYCYVHKVEVLPDNSLRLGQQLYYGGCNMPELDGIYNWLRPVIRLRQRSIYDYNYTTTNGPLILGVEVEDM